MKGAAILALVELAACTSPQAEEPCIPTDMVWQVESDNVLPSPYTPTRGTSDGSLLRVSSSMLTRIDANGRTVASTSTAGIFRIAMDDDGAPVVAAGRKLLAFDRDLVPTWSVDMPTDPVLDVARTGETAYLAYDFGTITARVHYVERDGRERWNARISETTVIRVASNGDVFVYDDNSFKHRIRLAAATGAIVESGPYPAIDGAGWWVLGTPLFERDGGIVLLTGAGDPGSLNQNTGVSRFDAAGQLMWHRDLHSTTESVVVSTNGDVLVTSSLRTQVVRLAGATGETVASDARCGAIALDWADANGYVLEQLTQQGVAGTIARYAD